MESGNSVLTQSKLCYFCRTDYIQTEIDWNAISPPSDNDEFKRANMFKNVCHFLNIDESGVPESCSPSKYLVCGNCERMVNKLWELRKDLWKTINEFEKAVVYGLSVSQDIRKPLVSREVMELPEMIFQAWQEKNRKENSQGNVSRATLDFKFKNKVGSSSFAAGVTKLSPFTSSSNPADGGHERLGNVEATTFSSNGEATGTENNFQDSQHDFVRKRAHVNEEAAAEHLVVQLQVKQEVLNEEHSSGDEVVSESDEDGIIILRDNLHKQRRVFEDIEIYDTVKREKGKSEVKVLLCGKCFHKVDRDDKRPLTQMKTHIRAEHLRKIREPIFTREKKRKAVIARKVLAANIKADANVENEPTGNFHAFFKGIDLKPNQNRMELE